MLIIIKALVTVADTGIKTTAYSQEYSFQTQLQVHKLLVATVKSFKADVLRLALRQSK